MPNRLSEKRPLAIDLPTTVTALRRRPYGDENHASWSLQVYSPLAAFASDGLPLRMNRRSLPTDGLRAFDDDRGDTFMTRSPVLVRFHH